MADNTVTLVGNLTRDPELRYTTGGRGVASFGLAVNRRYQVNGEWQEQTSFFNVVCWGQLGENAAATLTKGAHLQIEGEIRTREYTQKVGNGKKATEMKKSITEIRVIAINKLDRANKSEQAGVAAQGTAA